jgi:cysteinyl-tRNA synthetase
MLRTHYRQPIDWTLSSLDESHKIIWQWYSALDGVTPSTTSPRSVVDALSDDLNAPRAIAELHRLHTDGQMPELLAALRFLGFSGSRDRIARIGDAAFAAHGTSTFTGIGEAIEARSAARKARNFKEADRIRDALSAMGIQLKDSKDPATGEIVTTWEVKR